MSASAVYNGGNGSSTNAPDSQSITRTTPSRTQDTSSNHSTNDTDPEVVDRELNTSSDSNEDDAHVDAQLLSASILATIQSTPRHHSTPPSRNNTPYSGANGHTPSSHHKSSSSFHNGRNGAHDDSADGSRDELDHRRGEDGRRNGKPVTNHNMYPPSPTANITPRRRSNRIKSAKPIPIMDKDKLREKEKEKDRRVSETPSKRDNKSVSGSSSRRARKRIAAANDADLPQPVPVLGRSLDLTTLRTEPETMDGASDMYTDPQWAESVSMYTLARSWICAGVDLDPFHTHRPESAESVLLDMHDYIPPPALPPPATSAPPALPERPRYPNSNHEAFQAALEKGGETTPKLLRSYISNCKTFRTWWKANYTQRASKYKSRLAVLFPPSDQSQSSQSSQQSQSSQTSSQSSTQSSQQGQPRSHTPPPQPAQQQSQPQQIQPQTQTQTHRPRTPSPPPATAPSAPPVQQLTSAT